MKKLKWYDWDGVGEIPSNFTGVRMIDGQEIFEDKSAIKNNVITFVCSENEISNGDIIAYTLGEPLEVQRPIHPLKTNKPVKYHCVSSCNACGKVNEKINPQYEEGYLHESETKCLTCGHSDYWAYGFFESGQDIESKCSTYSFRKPLEGGE